MQGSLPGDDRTGLNRLGVPGEGAVAIQGLIGPCGAHTGELHTQRVGHSVLLSQAQDLVASVLEVSHATQGDAPRLGSRQAQVEALGLRVIGDNVLGVRVGLQGGVGQAIKADNVIQAVHSEGAAGNGEDATGIGHRCAGAHQIGIRGAKVNESRRGGAGTSRNASEGGVDFGGSQGDNVNVVTKSG